MNEEKQKGRQKKMKKENMLKMAGCLVKALLISIMIAAFIVLISTPGGMEDGVIGSGEGFLRMIGSFGAMVGAGWLANL